MTSLFMGQLFSGTDTPANEKVVRNTAEPVNPDKPAAEQTSAPDFNNPPETDHDPSLGLIGRQLASDWTEGIPVNAAATAERVDAVTDSTKLINQQVSTSGTAAGREMAGRTHRTLSYAYGIEPVADLRSNGHFGEQYFKRIDRDVQEGMGDYMTQPPGYDMTYTPGLSAAGKELGRQAQEASVYDTFYANIMGAK